MEAKKEVSMGTITSPDQKATVSLNKSLNSSLVLHPERKGLNLSVKDNLVSIGGL